MLEMFAKLARSNAKKSIKDYLIYFITITISVSLFYSFTSLSSSEYELITENTYNFNMIKSVLKYVTYFITGILIFLINYVNKYMIKRRQKEFSIHILLGTEQRKVALMFFAELIVVGLLSIVCGIFIGTLFSQVLTTLILTVAEQPIYYEFKIYMDTVGITFLFFMSMFCIIGLNNVRILNKIKLIDMMYANKQVEYKFKRSKYVYLTLFILSIILYCVCGYITFKLIKTFDVYFIARKMQFTLIAVLCYIFATYFFFYSLAYILIRIKEKNINYKYNGTNLFFIGTLVSKIKTTPILMASVSLTLMVAAISFMITLTLAQWSMGYLNDRLPYDLYINGFPSESYIKEHNISEIDKIDYKSLVDYIDKNGGKVNNYIEISKYRAQVNLYYNNSENVEEATVIGLTDYNNMRTMLGYDAITLDDNSYATHWQSTHIEEEKEYFFNNNDIININNHKLKLDKDNISDQSLGEYVYENFKSCLVIVPDYVADTMKLECTDLAVKLDEKLSYEFAEDFEYNYVKSWFKDNLKEYHSSLTRIKTLEKSEILNINLGMIILGIYLGVILLMISLTILSLSQLLDSIEHKDRFNVLRKLGIDESKVSKLVFKQVLLNFLLPLIVATVGFVVFLYNYMEMFSIVIDAYIGGKSFIFSIIIACSLLVFIYTCYLAGTYYTFKRNIDN